MKNYSLLEQTIISQFNTLKDKNVPFYFHGEPYFVKIAGKPVIQNGGGECKTDIFIRAEHSHSLVKDFKISIKDLSSAYIGSYINSETAHSFLGDQWSDILKEVVFDLKENFFSTPLFHTSGRLKNSITLGWRLDIEPVKKSKRTLSYPLDAKTKLINDSLYKGLFQEEQKKHAKLNGIIYENSGIADYIIFTNTQKINSAQDVINQMLLIDDAVLPSSRLAFKALNYRVDKRTSSNGFRPLAVYLDWNAENDLLVPTFHFNNPLINKGRESVEKLNTYFERLGVNQLNQDNIASIFTNKYNF